MDSFMEAQTQRAGELMERFIGQTLDFYENIKREDVFRKADGAAISRLLKKGIPQKGRPVD